MRLLIFVFILLAPVSSGCAWTSEFMQDRANDLMDCFKADVGYGLGISAQVRVTELFSAGVGGGYMDKYGFKGRRVGRWSDVHVGWPVGNIVLYPCVYLIGNLDYGNIAGALAIGCCKAMLSGDSEDDDWDDDWDDDDDEDEPINLIREDPVNPLWVWYIPLNLAYVGVIRNENRKFKHPLYGRKRRNIVMKGGYATGSVMGLNIFPYFPEDQLYKYYEKVPDATIDFFDIEVGIMAGVVGTHIGFSPGQFLDFILGWFHVDIAGDDVSTPKEVDLEKVFREPCEKQR